MFITFVGNRKGQVEGGKREGGIVKYEEISGKWEFSCMKSDVGSKNWEVSVWKEYNGIVLMLLMLYWVRDACAERDETY